MEREWLRESLFAGMTANAFELGTVLTCGWFWLRLNGCSMLYRGSSMETIAFENILVVVESDAGEISPPGYVQHNSGSTYFYVIRRANNCGDQEHTLSAAVKVSIDSEGELAEPQPNNTFAVRAEQVDGKKVELVWYYCPLEQQSSPAFFKVYYDGGTGQIDYENALAAIRYAGPRFYHYRSDSLDAGEYLFCIRTEDAAGAQSNSPAQIRIQLGTASPDAIEILSAQPA